MPKDVIPTSAACTWMLVIRRHCIRVAGADIPIRMELRTSVTILALPCGATILRITLPACSTFISAATTATASTRAVTTATEVGVAGITSNR